MDETQRSDLAILHGMALANTPLDPTEAANSMAYYRAHRDKCIDLYGADVTFHAEWYGVPLSDSD